MVLLALIMVSIGGMRSFSDDVARLQFLSWRLGGDHAAFMYPWISPNWQHFGNPGEGAPSKLTVIETGFTSLRPESSYSLLAIILGLSLINLGAYGTDQDMTQRLLTCKDARSGPNRPSWRLLWQFPHHCLL